MRRIQGAIGPGVAITLSLASLGSLAVACASRTASVDTEGGEPVAGLEARSSGAEGGRTAWDGIFSGAQARRGEAVVQSHCSRCHLDEGWPFVLDRWSGRRLVEFFDTLRTTMPLEYPGTLRPEEYAAIIAYILRQSGAPAGGRELPSDREGLAGITI